MDKSRIYFFPNVAQVKREEVCAKLGIQSTSNFGKYLGFPLKHRGSNKNRFKFVAEKVIRKLAGWKANYLSLGSRAILVKSVMSAIPNYVMQGSALLVHLCEKLDRVNKNFLWGITDKKRKIHLVGWSKIIKSK